MCARATVRICRTLTVGEVRRDGVVAFDDLALRDDFRVVVERQLARQKRVENDAQRPHVRFYLRFSNTDICQIT